MLKRSFILSMFLLMLSGQIGAQETPPVQTREQIIRQEIAREQALLAVENLSEISRVNGLIMLADMYFELGELNKVDDTLRQLSRLLPADSAMERFSLTVRYIELSKAKEDYIKALNYVTQAELLNKSFKLNLINLRFLINKAEILIELNRGKLAKKSMEAIEQMYSGRIDKNNLEEQLSFLLINALYEEKMGDLSKAYEFYDEYIQTYREQSKKLLNQQTEQLTKKYHADKLKLDASNLERDVAIKKANLMETSQKNKLQFYYLIAFVVALCLLVLLLFRQIRVRNKLKVLSERDALTQIFNRRSLFEQGSRLVVTAIDNNSPLSAILFDIDNFKSINDSHGHHVGDLVIRKVAECATRVLRDEDVVGRIGGEEFVAILPNNTAGEAIVAAERLKAECQACPITLENEEVLNFTASFGVCSLEEAERFTIDSLINGADKAMYTAKSTGKNRIELAHKDKS